MEVALARADSSETPHSRTTRCTHSESGVQEPASVPSDNRGAQSRISTPGRDPDCVRQETESDTKQIRESAAWKASASASG